MQKGQATEYLVLTSVVLVIGLLAIAILIWPMESTKDVKKKQFDIQYGIKILDDTFLSGTISYFHLNEGSGTTARDSKSSATGTFTSSPQWVDGISGSALQFDGIDDKVTINKLMFDDSQPIFTYSLWVKANNAGMTSQKIIGQDKGGSNNNLCFCICYKPATTTLYALESGSGACSNTECSSSSITYTQDLSQWTHIVATYDNSSSGNKSKLYINGVFVAGSTSTRYCSQPIYLQFVLGKHIHTYGSSSDQSFNGTIDEVRVFDRAITPDEAYQLYKNPDKP